MISYILLIPILVSFFASLFLVPIWIKKAKQIGLIWKDMNKYENQLVAGSGGIIVVLGFVIGILVYIAYRTFYLNTRNNFLVEIFALLTVILLVSTVGFIDDLLGWQRGGLSIRARSFAMLFSAIPLIIINAGKSDIYLPLVGGSVDIGLFYPLILIPIGIVGATTAYNILAGCNGLEAGQGVIILSALSIVAYFTNHSWLAVIALCMIASLIAFLVYNFSPAKVFPGDSLTYAVGSLIAIMAIMGNFEKIAVFFFIPYILETILKFRGNFKKYSFGKPMEDGTLELRYDKIYSLNHLSILLMKKLGVKPTERKVVFSIWLFQILIIIIGFVIFREGIFAK